MAEPKNPAAESNDGGRADRAGANATAQGKSQSTSTETVTVGCKLPHGLILDMTVAGQPPRRFRVKGMNSARVIGGYGITQGVPKDFWDKWIRKNVALSFVKKGLIFAEGDRASAIDKAKDGAKLLTGLEPINPEKPATNITKDDAAPGNAPKDGGDDPFEDEQV